MSSLQQQLSALGPIEKPFEQKKQASLIFDPQQSARIDLQTIYSLAIEGLNELIKLDSKFKPFQETLFSKPNQLSSRAQQSADVNKRFDEAIDTFLRILSQYVLLRPSHQALEYLIRRFE